MIEKLNNQKSSLHNPTIEIFNIFVGKINEIIDVVNEISTKVLVNDYKEQD